MILPDDIVSFLKGAAKGAAYEQCGLIGRSMLPNPETSKYSWRIYPIRNVHALQQDNYLMDVLDQRLAYEHMEAVGFQLWGAAHTHRQSAVPSRQDAEQWNYPPSLHMVIATAEEVRVYRTGYDEEERNYYELVEVT